MSFASTITSWRTLAPWQRRSVVLLVTIYSILIALLLWFRPVGVPAVPPLPTELATFNATDPYYQHYYYYWGSARPGQFED